ncbi:C2H2-like zinc finger protein [Raphanus sativus]|nr:C2H2-like zinc finger protein [Raphanus sativus]
MQVTDPRECSLCNHIFSTPQDLISHTNTFHPSHHFSSFSSSAAAAPTTFRHYTNLNRNPNPVFQAGNRFDLNYYRRGYTDEQERLHGGFPAITPANRANFPFGQQEKRPKLMNLFPAMPSEDLRTLPLICQLEQRIPHDTAMERDETISDSIDLTLRLSLFDTK